MPYEKVHRVISLNHTTCIAAKFDACMCKYIVLIKLLNYDGSLRQKCFEGTGDIEQASSNFAHTALYTVKVHHR